MALRHRLAAALVALLAALLLPAAARAVPPTVDTTSATAVGPDTFNANGGVDPNGTDTSYYFLWNEFGGGSYDYGTSPTDLGSGSFPIAVQAQLRAVSDWTYHYNLHAYNTSNETADGSDQVVHTPPYASAPGAPGDLDVPGTPTGSPGFAVQGRAGPTNDGSDGTGFPNTYPDDVGNAMAVQQDGAVVVAGTAGATGFITPGGFALRRFTASGDVDSSFNSGSHVVTTFSGESNVSGNAVGLQALSGPDTGIVVAGDGSSGSGKDVLLARYTPSGGPDGTFGPGGTSQLVEAGGGSANALVVAPDNTLWVAGGNGSEAKLWHFDKNGTKVLSELTLPGTGSATALARQSDGKLVAAAGSGSTLVLIRFTSAGALDTAFGSGGIASAPAAGPALAVAVDEHLCGSPSCPKRTLAVAGGDSTHFTLARFDESGTRDSTFGTSGVVTTSGTGSPARALVVQGDGKLIAGGVDVSNPATGPEMLLARYGSSGALDSSFGISGRVRTGYPDPAAMNSTTTGVGADGEVAALSLRPDGRVLAAGSDANTPNIIPSHPGSSRRSAGLVSSGVVPDMALAQYQGGPPGTRITFGPPATTGATSATFSFTSTVTPATFECSVDGGAWKACHSGDSFGPLSFANHTFSVRSTDNFAHTDPSPPVYKWKICSGCDTLPNTELTGKPPALSNSHTAAFTFAADNPSDTFQCQLDGASFTTCSSPDVISGLADGAHTFVVRAVNGKGSDPTPPSYHWTIDTVPPHTTITAGPSGTIKSPTATFAFKSDESGSRFECRLDGGAFTACFSPTSYVVADGTHTFTVRAIDAAGNVDPAPPTRTFTFKQTACSGTVSFDYVNAQGCFGKTGGRYVSTPGTDVNLNGLTIHPDSSSTTIGIDPVEHRVTSSGPVAVNASEVPVDHEQLNWSIPRPKPSGSVDVGALNPPSGAAIAGLPFEGDVSLALNDNKGADINGNVQLPFGTIAKALEINGTVSLHTTLSGGLQHDRLTVERDYMQIGGIGIKQLKVVYSSTDDLWEGAASIVLPTPHELGVAADLQFQHGNFHRFAGSLDHIDYPVIDGVYLQRIAVVFGVDPTTIGGGLGLSFGPEVDGSTLVGVDGNFLYQSPFGNSPGHIHVDGTVTLAGIKLANGYFDYFTSGLVQFGAQAQVGLPDTSDPNPKNEDIYITAALAGVVQAPHFDVDVKANVDLNFIDTSVSAEVLVSDVALVACAHLSAWGFSWDPGGAYTWSDGNLDLMFDGCSVGPYETLPLASDAAAGGSALRLGSGGSLVALTGSTAAPKVVLSGPHGQSITVPAGSVAPLMVRGFMVFQDPKHKTTYIAIQHSAGTWRITPQPGSSAITQVRSAKLLPSPKVSARVRGHGRRRTLKWHLRKIPGQRVVFWEKGRDSAKIIGSTSRPHGKLRFTIANASAGRRAIVAQVLSYGKPRKDLTIAHFHAPAPLKPAKPKHLKVTGVRGGGVRISWHRSALAQQYIIEIQTRDGAHLVEFASQHTHSITVHNVVPITAAKINVTGATQVGVHGRAASIRYTAQPKHHKHHKHRHGKHGKHRRHRH